MFFSLKNLNSSENMTTLYGNFSPSFVLQAS